MDFGRPNAEIGRKMANGQLLFLALYLSILGTCSVKETLLWNVRSQSQLIDFYNKFVGIFYACDRWMHEYVMGVCVYTYQIYCSMYYLSYVLYSCFIL